MQREIEFRGKRVDNGEWVYGCYSQINGKPIMLQAIDSYKYYKRYFLDVPFNEVTPETVGQYTGLKDKNGQKIYEGDIISAGYYRWKCKVVWDEKCARFIGLTSDKDVRIVYVDMVDKNNKSAVWVVGNIYENPELLQETE